MALNRRKPCTSQRSGRKRPPRTSRSSKPIRNRCEPGTIWGPCSRPRAPWNRRSRPASASLDATQAIVHFNLAHVLHGLDRVPEAIGHYLKTLELNPQSMAAQFNLGVLPYENRQWAQAEAAFRETIAIAPEADRAHHCLGELLFDQRRYDQALAFADRAAELAPEDAEYQFNRAKCLRH